MPMKQATLTLEDARLMIAAAEKKAEALGVPSDVAVVDAGGNLIAFERMNGAWLGSISIAIDKAWTARAFDMSTRDLSRLAGTDDPAFGIHNTNDDRVVIFPGGVPVKSGTEVIGAVGSSGGKPDEDHAIAQAAVAAL
jgi:uncharacterized protein GlcG (DUF336 family)